MREEILPALILIVRLLHVLSAMAMVAGILARQIVRLEALRSTDVRAFAALTDASRRLESLFVIPGSTAVGLLGLLLAWMTGAPLLGFLEGADRNWLLVAIVLMLATFLTVPLAFLPQRRRMQAALKVALAEGRITDQLRLAAADPVARFWHVVEQVAVVAIVALMSLRPF